MSYASRAELYLDPNGIGGDDDPSIAHKSLMVTDPPNLVRAGLGSKPSRSIATCLFVVVEGLDALHASVSRQMPPVMPLEKQFYGMRESAVADPDGRVITFAEPYQE